MKSELFLRPKAGFIAPISGSAINVLRSFWDMDSSTTFLLNGICSTSLFCFTMGTGIYACLNLGIVIRGIQERILSGGKYGGFLSLLVDLPYAVVNLRAFAILAICFSKQSTLQSFEQRFFSTYCAGFLIKKHEKNIRRLENMLAAGLIAVHFCWEAFEWGYYFYADPERLTFEYTGAFNPLPIKCTTINAFVIWTVFCTLPFCVSQFVLLKMIRYAFWINKAVGHLRKNVETLKDEILAEPELLHRAGKDLARLRTQHMVLTNCVDSFNQEFGILLLAFYGLDTLAVCCFISGFVTGTDISAFVVTYNIFSLSVFIFYGVGLMVPFILVHRQV